MQLPVNNNFIQTHLQFFPSIAWMIFAQQNRDITLEVNETFPRQTFRNRCLLLSSDGVQAITVPTKRSPNGKILTKDVEISWKEDWNVRAWRAVYSNYGKSPYFEYYDREIHRLLTTKHRFLMDMNVEIFEFLKKSFNLDIQLFITDDFQKQNQATYLNCFQPKTRQSDGSLLKPYYQVFSDRFPFETNLSSLDLLFNLGRDGGHYIKNSILPQNQG